ncbi:MAG: sigma-70 family RNA polymerase sigma factor [Anaerolineae bacterium]|nr:sigma-70 family RNA polymerase sigma factor [Anaerolineae bacterium]
MHGEGDTAALCQAAVRQLVGEFNWRLLSEEELVARAVETLAEKPQMTPTQACQNVYSRVLYDACQDAHRQEQAYCELHYYLYRIACGRCPSDLVEDATQQALLLIFAQIDTCRKPGAFLRFAQLKLLQAIKTVQRRHGWGRETLVDDLLWISSEGPMPTDDRVEDLWDCIRHIWEKHPRARNQLRAVLWKYFDGLSDEEIAAWLKKRPADVHVLRSRGLKKLRRCMAEQGNAVDRRSSGH